MIFWISALSGSFTVSPCLSVCLSVCLFIIFLRNRLLNFLIFGMMLGVNCQKLIELDFWWKFIIWSYLGTRGQKWRKMRFRNFDKNCHFVFLKVVEKERLWCYLFLTQIPYLEKFCSWVIAQKLLFNQNCRNFPSAISQERFK